MKTKLLSIFMVLCLSLLNAQTYLLNDDFETDAIGTLPEGWVIRYNGTGNANQIVVDNPIKNGLHSFQVSGSSWAANLSKYVSEMPNEVSLEAWAYAENVTTGGRSGIAIGNPSIATWGAFIARIEFYNGNIIAYHHTGYSGGYGTQYVLQTAIPNTWYHFKIEANFSSETYKVYINGEQAISDTGGTTTTEFPLLANTIPTSAELYGNSMIYFDDVKLYETSDLVAYYPFNGNANDESGNELHGTVSGAALTMDRFNNPSSAYNFDGNDIITIAHNDILNSSNELSFSVWVKPNLQQNAMILGKSNYSNATNYLLRTKSTGYIQFEYIDFANSNSLPLIVNDWNHIAVVSNTDNSKMVYINGVLATHTGASSPFGLVNNALTIGARSLDGGESFQGAIDDIRIYKTALTETEVLSLYNNNSLDISDTQMVQNNGFNVYNNNLYFDEDQNLSEIKSITVYNLLAQNVFESIDIQREMSLNLLNQGVYILKVEHTNGNITTKKFIIN